MDVNLCKNRINTTRRARRTTDIPKGYTVVAMCPEGCVCANRKGNIILWDEKANTLISEWDNAGEWIKDVMNN